MKKLYYKMILWIFYCILFVIGTIPFVSWVLCSALLSEREYPSELKSYEKTEKILIFWSAGVGSIALLLVYSYFTV